MKKILLARCGNEDDQKLINKFLDMLKPEEFEKAFFRNSFDQIEFIESSTEIKPDTYLSLIDVFQQNKLSERFEEIIVIHAHKTTLDPKNLYSSYKRFFEVDNDYYMADFNQAYGQLCRMEYLKSEPFKNIDSIEPKWDYFFGERLDPDNVIFPRTEDFDFSTLEVTSPKSVNMQIVDGCNKKCTKCYYRAHSNKPHVDITEETLDRILDEIATFDPKPIIWPCMNSEVLLASRLDHFMRKTEQHGIPVSIATNGLLLDEEKATLLLKHKNFKTLNFSVDAYSEELYQKVQPGGTLKQVEENIHMFIELRKKMNREDVLINMPYVVDKNNDHEADKFIDKWLPIVNNVMLITMEYLTEDKSCYAKPFVKTSGKTICRVPFLVGIIDINNLYICPTLEKEKEYIYSLEEHTIPELWYDKLSGIREDLVNGCEPDLCKRCDKLHQYYGLEMMQKGDRETVISPYFTSVTKK